MYYLFRFSDDFDISKLTARCYCSQYCRIPGNKDICQIEGIDVIPERRTMIVLDSNNKNLKVFDSMVFFRASYSFDYSEYGPKAMSVLNTEEVVVSVYAETQSLWTRLIILNIKGKEISHVHTIPIEGLVIRAIACHQEKISIAGNDVRRTDGAFVKLIDRDGKIYWSTAMEDNNTKNASPGYMTCFPYQGGLAVVVIDVSNNKLWKYDGNMGNIVVRRQRSFQRFNIRRWANVCMQPRSQRYLRTYPNIGTGSGRSRKVCPSLHKV